VTPSIPVPPRLARRRGRVATHDPETLLDLVAAGAHAAVVAHEAAVAERVAMPAFNRARAAVDRARGVDPAGSERTPTAEAIQMRFKQLAGRPVSWRELVDGWLRAGRNRTMWLSALARDEKRDDLTDHLVIHALGLVAAARETDALARREYAETRDALVAAESQRNGDDATLDRVLPTLNAVLAYCDFRWTNAPKLAGLRQRGSPQQGERRHPASAAIPGTPIATVIAFYAALNGVWPSYPVLRHFAGSCGIRMQDKGAGRMGPLREQAALLLAAEGVAAPTRTRGGGKGRRLTYRYPVNGLPGALLRDRADRRQQLRTNPRLAELRRGLAVVSLRVWLAGLDAGARRVRVDYVNWAVGTDWVPASVFDKYGHGGFTALKKEAAEANAAVRRAGGDPLTEAVAHAGALRAERDAIYKGGTARQTEAVAFGVALRAVLAGPHAEAQPPRQ
jgi:hypothetical protein